MDQPREKESTLLTKRYQLELPYQLYLNEFCVETEKIKPLCLLFLFINTSCLYLSPCIRRYQRKDRKESRAIWER